MAEIEIRTSGELMLAGEVIGQITWARPYIERDVAGVYELEGWGRDDFGLPYDYECAACEEKTSVLNEAQHVLERVLDRVVKSEAEAASLGLAGDIPHHLDQMRRDLEALDLEP